MSSLGNFSLPGIGRNQRALLNEKIKVAYFFKTLRQRDENLNHVALNSRSWKMGQSLKQEKQGRDLRKDTS